MNHKYYPEDRDPNHQPVEGEPDFYETNCHWVDCHQEYDTQEQLVRVSQLVLNSIFCLHQRNCFAMMLI